MNFVSERIKLFYRFNLLGTAFKPKNKLPFKLLKPQFIGRTHGLLNLSRYLNISFEKIYDLLYSTMKQVKQNS